MILSISWLRDNQLTSGEYFVKLPDGRTQRVTYTVDGYSGFDAKVTYEGEAKYETTYAKSEPPTYYVSDSVEPKAGEFYYKPLPSSPASSASRVVYSKPVPPPAPAAQTPPPSTAFYYKPVDETKEARTTFEAKKVFVETSTEAPSSYKKYTYKTLSEAKTFPAVPGKSTPPTPTVKFYQPTPPSARYESTTALPPVRKYTFRKLSDDDAIETNEVSVNRRIGESAAAVTPPQKEEATYKDKREKRNWQEPLIKSGGYFVRYY